MTAPPTVQLGDSDLVKESLSRPEAFAALFDRYSGMLYRYVSRRLGPETADDLVGETFLVAFARRDRYDPAYADARPWLFGIVTKLLSRHHRTEAARYRALLRSPTEERVESPADRVAAGVTARAARPALARALTTSPAAWRRPTWRPPCGSSWSRTGPTPPNPETSCGLSPPRTNCSRPCGTAPGEAPLLEDHRSQRRAGRYGTGDREGRSRPHPLLL
ncbi:RNA polymerase sigma factor [Planobispora rosea]|nr:sigma-70 family RNA polymerase sigma factor [Planobispora rosea]